MNYAFRAAELRDEIAANRHYLHRNAELSLKEYGTTDFLCEKLSEIGIPITRFSDYCGVIGTIRGAYPGRTVLLRADIDALPIDEASGVEFQSVNPGVMHACGHDAHTAMLLGAAKMLWESREALHGTVKLLFQSGEEVFIGSHYYWDRGYLSDVDAAMGMHVWQTIPAGKMAIQDGYLMASCDNFTLTVHGLSAHGSTPHIGHDAIVAASAIIMNLQSIVGRFSNPLEPLVVTIGKIRAGKQFNIISDCVVMEGTIRTYDPGIRAQALKAVEDVSAQTAAVYGCTTTLQFDEPEFSVCNRDPVLNQIARDSAVSLYGPGVLATTPRATGSEDFSYIMDKIPSSLFIFLGYYEEESGCTVPVHNEKFRINEDILPIGAAQYAQFAADYLEKTAGGEA